MIYNYLILLNGKTVKKGKKFFQSEVAELKFEQAMYAKYAIRDNDVVDVIFR